MSIILSLRNPGLSPTRTELNLHCVSSAHFTCLTLLHLYPLLSILTVTSHDKVEWIRMGRRALTKTPLFAPSMERMNFLDCR
ncbi:hypothetical protein Peur_045269 [Populus x canadensis]